VKLLRRSEEGALRADTVLTYLKQTFNDADARAQLDTAIDWGRYAELFEYDADSGRLYLPQPADSASSVG
jgi:NitT/TauT family transport system ATP-binding protein